MINGFPWRISWRVKARVSSSSVSVWQTHRRLHSWWAQHVIHLLVMTHILHTKTLSLFSYQPSDILTCPPGHIVTAVLSVLKLASGMLPPAGSGELSRHIMHCGRVQKCALEALIALGSSPGKYVRQQQTVKAAEERPEWDSLCFTCLSVAKEKTADVFTVLIQYLNNPDTDPTVSCVFHVGICNLSDKTWHVRFVQAIILQLTFAGLNNCHL